jgi:putative FmdB family regulatory protein
LFPDKVRVFRKAPDVNVDRGRRDAQSAMPIYEYEPTEHDCLICENRFEVIQEIPEAPLEFCPTCGMPCRRIVSAATFKMSIGADPERAAKRGFTTWRKAGSATWEKIAGPGYDVLQGTPEEIRAVEEEKKTKKPIDLDDKS